MLSQPRRNRATPPPPTPQKENQQKSSVPPFHHLPPPPKKKFWDKKEKKNWPPPPPPHKKNQTNLSGHAYLYIKYQSRVTPGSNGKTHKPCVSSNWKSTSKTNSSVANIILDEMERHFVSWNMLIAFEPNYGCSNRLNFKAGS